MKILIAVLFFVIGVNNVNAAVAVQHQENVPVQFIQSLDSYEVGGTIVMVEDMMRVSSPNGPITGITVYNEAGTDVIWQPEACQESKCDYNTTPLSSGTYYVEVAVEGGESFSGYITKS